MKNIPYIFFITLLLFPFSNVFGQSEMEALRDYAARFTPLQSDVEIDLISEQEIPLCELVVSEDQRTMTLVSPQGVVLRRFADTGPVVSGKVNRFSYYLNGVEVFREMDTTGNEVRDQFRWLNNAGTRWGADTTGNGRIDHWIQISAEEVSREIALALATGDAQRFAAVALTEGELRSLELGETLNRTVAQKVAALQTGFAEAAAAIALARDAEWFQLSGDFPGTVPAGEQGNRNDLLVFENAVVVVGEGANMRQISIGTLVKIGHNNWRVLDLPRNHYFGQAPLFTFIQPAHVPGVAGASANEIVEMMSRIEALRSRIPTVPAAQRPAVHTEIISLLLGIVSLATTQAEQDDWIREIADSITQAVAQNEFPDGREQIASLFTAVNRPDRQEIAAHVRSQQIFIDYHLALESGTDQMRAYTQLLDDLEEFVTTFSRTETGLHWMMNLASFREMLDPTNAAAIEWYERVIELVPGQPRAAKARGAIRRLTAEGLEIPFRGFVDTTGRAFDIANYNGRFVLLCFWDARSAAVLPRIQRVTDEFEQAGLATISINLDFDEATLRRSLQGAPTTWRHLHTPGGTEGLLAVYWGIMTTPYMILYDREGRVARATITSVDELDQVLTELMR